MYKPANMSLWQGRVDEFEGEAGLRWHQLIQPFKPEVAAGVAILGFASDAGVKRNQGRPGASQGPVNARQMLANLPNRLSRPVYDAGDIICTNDQLEFAQLTLACQVEMLLAARHFPLVIGGGHEVAWGSYQGLAKYAEGCHQQPVIGIINFDAHFDLRQDARPSSGTPFRQIAEYCQTQQTPFKYCCLGISEPSNTAALFNRAQQLEVSYRLDRDMNWQQLPAIEAQLDQFIQQCDWLYLTVCLDVFPSATAPGVSAPAVCGVELALIEHLIQNKIKPAIDANGFPKLKLTDIAEFNPEFDRDQQTARLVARLTDLITR
ncbi:formimidoylglutamase [Spartinivicinus poritis]|uniref:Formimidoylglutamase n=1 Tax=Spartinivicinus poritis TaxID=2994640 RepID=A0ABT5U4Z9_9GAMM|nr:formimidoylglutamase [Spartinivicinus sp. A2-2]MDE1460558.1 formimidoylglutamase [Spartinivicinus sp. A2-2]